MKDKLLHILEFQDTFKTPFNFLFNGKKNIHFPIGIISSLIINVTTFCFSITLILQLINHSEPSVNYAKITSSMSPNITLNTKELLFTIAIRDKYYNLINDPRYASLIATYEKTYSENGNYTVESINLEFMNCSNVYHLFKELEVSNRFDSTGLINYNCYNYSQPIIIGGKYGTDFYANLKFYVMKCRNSTNSKIICKSEEEINEVIQNGWLQITFVSSYIDITNYSNPIQYITEDTYFNLDVSMNKQMYIYFSLLEIYSKNNIILWGEKKETATKYDFSSSDIISILEDGIISSIMVCPSFNIDKYYRKYIKVQEIGASIGGLYNSLKMILIILFSYHRFRYIEMNIMNELFYFAGENFMKKKSSIFKCECFNYSNIRLNTINNKNYIYKKNINSSKIKEIFNERKNINSPKNNNGQSSVSIKFTNTNKINLYKIDLGFINSLKLLFYCCNKEIKKNFKDYILIKNELLKYIDYIQVSKYLMDIEKIKGYFKKNNLKYNNWKSEKKLLLLNNNNKIPIKKIDKSNLINSKLFYGGNNGY